MSRTVRIKKKYNCGVDHPKFINLVGKRFGELTALEFVQHTSKKGRTFWVWKCLCSCGNVCYPRVGQLLREKQQRCKLCADARSAKARTLKDSLSLKKRIYRNYMRNAEARGFSFSLTFDEFVAIITQSCYYCGSSPSVYACDLEHEKITGTQFKRVGVDRIDNAKGYTVDNVVPCCGLCNRNKGNLPLTKFYSWCYRLFHNLQNKKTFNDYPCDGSTTQADGVGKSTDL